MKLSELHVIPVKVYSTHSLYQSGITPITTGIDCTADSYYLKR